MSARAVVPERQAHPLPIETARYGSPGSMGMLLTIATDAMVFGCLLASYFFLQATAGQWPPSGIEKPDLKLIGVNSLILWGSSIPMQWADSSIKQGHRGRLALGLALGAAMGTLFLILQGVEYSQKSFGPQDSVYGSLFYTITAFHGLHVFTALLMNGVVQVRNWLGHFDRERHLAVQNTVIFWHFVDLIWIFIFASLYLSPWVL